MSNEEVIDLSEGFDISFLEDEEIDSKYLQESSKVSELEKEIKSFLSKLKSNPKANTIKWPSRIADIKTFEEKIDNIVNR